MPFDHNDYGIMLNFAICISSFVSLTGKAVEMSSRSQGFKPSRFLLSLAFFGFFCILFGFRDIREISCFELKVKIDRSKKGSNDWNVELND